MKIAIDFDGTIVDKVFSDKYLDLKAYQWFIDRMREKGATVDIVSARPKISNRYLEAYTGISLNHIYCCEGVQNKINLINKKKYDIVIDNEQEILDKLNSTFKFNISDYGWSKLGHLLISKKPFSPGPVPQNINMDIIYSHRNESFSRLYSITKNKVLWETGLSNTMNLLFIQGSGTAAIEAAFSSLSEKYLTHIVVFNNGTFGGRAAEIAKKYFFCTTEVSNYSEMNEAVKKLKPQVFFYTQFETSKSIYNKDCKKILKYCKKNNIITIADCVSSLGFYETPDVDIICSSSAKILSGCPVMGLVFYKDKKIFAEKGRNFYLDISRYIESDEHNQTPHTSLIPQLYTLNENIENRATEEEIITNCKQIKTKKLKIINEKIAPVLTFSGKKKDLDKVFKYFKIFGIEPYYNSVYMKDYFQLSMFSYKDKKIYQFVNKIIEVAL